MKTSYILYVIAMICFFPAQGQPFSSVTLGNTCGHEVIRFSMPSETNVLYYRVEASNDSVDYAVIGTVRSTGNSVLAKSYSYDLYETAYKYYRIAMVGMNARLQYSSHITIAQKGATNMPGAKEQSMPAGPAIVTNTK